MIFLGMNAPALYCVVNVCDAHYVYVDLVEEKALGVYRVWKLIWSVYRIKTKVEANALLKDKYLYFTSVLSCM